MSCCPPGSYPYLNASYTAKGKIVATGAIELYEAPVQGSPASALIMCPDVWGWNGGRMRAVADSFAAQGYLVVVPKLLATPALDGGTDGDALPPDGAFSLDWIKNFPWEKQKPKMADVLAYVKSKGVAKVGMMGFCYGGHPTCWTSKDDAEGLVACGVVFHPSMQLEAPFGGDVEALLKGVQCPMLIAPAGNDVPMWAEDGAFGQALKASRRGAEVIFKEYPEMKHGWTVRGDLADAAVARDVEDAMAEATAFLAKYLK